LNFLPHHSIVFFTFFYLLSFDFLCASYADKELPLHPTAVTLLDKYFLHGENILREVDKVLSSLPYEGDGDLIGACNESYRLENSLLEIIYEPLPAPEYRERCRSWFMEAIDLGFRVQRIIAIQKNDKDNDCSEDEGSKICNQWREEQPAVDEWGVISKKGRAQRRDRSQKYKNKGRLKQLVKRCNLRQKRGAEVS